MSKLMTIYNVMKGMKNVEEIKGTVNVKVTSNGEKVLNRSKEIDCAKEQCEWSGEGQRFYRGYGMMRHDRKDYHIYGKSDADGKVDEKILAERMKAHEARLTKLGFAAEEIEALKMHRKKRMERRNISRIDRVMQMIKLLDKVDLTKEENHKVLSLTLTNEDAPDFWQEMLEDKKQSGLVKKFLTILQEKEVSEILDAGNCHEAKHKEHINQLKETAAKIKASGIVIETLHPEKIAIKVEISNDYKVKKATTLMQFSDDSGKIVVVEGQRIIA